MAFTSQISGSPFTTPTNNIGGIAYVNHGGSPAVKRIYYTADTDFTKVFCMSLTGAADTTREFLLNNQGEAQVYPARGLASDGTYLYALVGTLGAQYIHVYRISDRRYIANYPLGFSANHYARGLETYQRPGRLTEKRIVTLQDNIVRSYLAVVSSSSLSMSQQNDGTFALPTNVQVTSGNWQSLVWDSTVDRLLLVAEQTTGQTEQDKVFGFTYTGARDDREDFLPGVDIDAMTYNGDDADLYMVHETSTNLYAWGDFPRFIIPDDFDFNITEGTTYTANLARLVDSGATFAMQTNTDDGFYDNLVFGGDGTLTWTDPPAPRGGASQQNVSLTIRATIGGNSTDHTFPFILHAAAVPIVAPTFTSTAFPRQVVYEPYTPPAGAPTPNLAHNFAINLSDYLATGTQPVNWTARADGGDFPGTFSITTRYVNQRPIQDRLVFNASAVAASQLNRYISVTADNTSGNMGGTSTQRIPFEVIDLAYPTPQGSDQVNISDTQSHSIYLPDIFPATPQATYSFVGTPPAALNAHINNLHLTLRPNALGTSGPLTYLITIAATNILTSEAGVQYTLHINVSQAQAPRSAPVFIPGPVVLRTNRGQTNRYDLNQIIQSANPQPTFSVGGESGALGTLMGEIVQQHFFQYTIPDTITTDTNWQVNFTATNDVDAASKDATVTGIAVTRPRLTRPIPTQTVHVGGTLTINLADYVEGQTPLMFSFDGDYTPPSNMTLANASITFSPAEADYTTATNVIPQVDVENALGRLRLVFDINVTVDEEPAWTAEAVKLQAIEGEVSRYNMAQYLTAGHPAPTLRLADNAVGIPAIISFDGLTMMLTPTSNNVMSSVLNFGIIAGNNSGEQTKQIEVDVRPVFDDNEDIVLSVSDLNEIRKLIDTNLEPGDLPDNVISGDTIVGAAVAWARDRMPVYPNNPRTLNELTSKRRAVIYRAAGNLAASVRRSQDPNLTVTEIDEFQLANSLNAKAEMEADLAQKRFDELGTSDNVLVGIFEVVS